MPQPTRQPLHESPWTVGPVGDLTEVPAAARQPVPAEVPGCVHTDLMAAELIGDPAAGFNEQEQQWIGRTDWEYRCRFGAESGLFEHDRIDLVCEGLDTIATVEMNGQPVGTAANMFHPHRFDARAALRRGENELVIRFRSPIRHIREEEARLGSRPVNGDWEPYIFIRKAACNFGWDWAPKVATCGVWRPIRLEGWSGLRIAGVRPLIHREDADRWRVDVWADLEWAGPVDPDASWRLSASLAGDVAREESVSADLRGGERAPVLSIKVNQPRLWWPRGSGVAHRYDLRIFLAAGTASPGHDEGWRGRVGFREIRLNTSRDEHGSQFTIEVNGRPVFCKGANWIPDGLFPARVTRERYRERLRQAADANMNTLRVWGGGYYESDEFYDLCDELGILVWQDFVFACAMYPEESPYPALIEAEARHEIARLSPHPSVALWCGGNECAWAHDSWGTAPGETATWKQRLGDLTWGRGYYFDLFPRLVAELDPTRPYWPNSPWPGSDALPPNDADHGDRHTWDAWGDGYRAIVPRFCSELGHQGPANRNTLAWAVGAEPLRLGSPDLEHRQRATGGTPRHIDAGIAASFRPPRDFDEWHYLAQLMQARSVQTGIEWLRINQPRCMGALVWQLNDAWPGMSWSLIDSDGRPKPAWHAAAAAFQNRLFTIQPLDGRPTVVVVNDTDDPWSGKVDVRREGLDGTARAEATALAFSVAPRSVLRVADIQERVGRPDNPAAEVVIAQTIKRRRCWYYLPDRELAYPQPRFDARARRDDSGALTIRCVARTLIREPMFHVERAGWPLQTDLDPTRTLLPGDTFAMACEGPADPADLESVIARLADPALFQCANRFGLAAPT